MRRIIQSALNHGPRRLQPGRRPLIGSLLQHQLSSSSSLFSRTVATAAAAKRLAGKTILITGASSGIGRSTALEFARAAGGGGNLRLILAARREESLKKLAEEIREEVGNGAVQVLPVKLDVSDVAAVKGFVGELPEDWRDIDVLVNNAYVFLSPTHVFRLLNHCDSGLVRGVDRAPNIKEDDINVMFNTNVTGLINVTQAILPIFLKRPDGGHGDIINIASIAGLSFLVLVLSRSYILIF